MAPQDDLTAAERAEQLLTKLGMYPWPYRIKAVMDNDAQTRQEALREARDIVEDWPLGIEDRLSLLDRLASEGPK
jgi:hypothetical protein